MVTIRLSLLLVGGFGLVYLDLFVLLVVWLTLFCCRFDCLGCVVIVVLLLVCLGNYCGYLWFSCLSGDFL